MTVFGPDILAESAAFIDPSAKLFGRITLGKDVSIWPNVVMRAEVNEIRIGAQTNIQDFVMVHIGYSAPTIVGEECSITHHATLHGCRIGDRCLVGINSTVMDGAEIGDNSIVAGHAIVSEGAKFPANSVLAGVPAKRIAERDSGAENSRNALFYRTIAKAYAQGHHRLTSEERALCGLSLED